MDERALRSVAQKLCRSRWRGDGLIVCPVEGLVTPHFLRTAGLGASDYLQVKLAIWFTSTSGNGSIVPRFGSYVRMMAVLHFFIMHLLKTLP